MLDLGCLTLLGVVCLRRTVSFINIGLSCTHGAKYDGALSQTYLVILSVRQVIRLHFRWFRIQARDTFSALDISHVQYINLFTGIFGTT